MLWIVHSNQCIDEHSEEKSIMNIVCRTSIGHAAEKPHVKEPDGTGTDRKADSRSSPGII
jgi:hypothetical protein